MVKEGFIVVMVDLMRQETLEYAELILEDMVTMTIASRGSMIVMLVLMLVMQVIIVRIRRGKETVRVLSGLVQ